jgi:hypothetical protein
MVFVVANAVLIFCPFFLCFGDRDVQKLPGCFEQTSERYRNAFSQI